MHSIGAQNPSLVYLKIAEDVLEDTNIGDSRWPEAHFRSASNGEDKLKNSMV